MQFEHPQLLWLALLFAPALAAFLAWAQRRKARVLTQFIEARLLPALVQGVSTAHQRWRGALLIGGGVCLVIAIARPQWGFTWEEARQRGLDIVVAIDTSKSMLAEDVAPNRLMRAKLAVLDLMQQAKSDRLGLVAFAGTAFLMCPLTLDDEAFRQSVNALDVDIIPQGGTALASAIDAALTAFKENDADNHKILVLFTDGEDHDPDAVSAAERAAKEGLRIFTIGIGSAEGELLRITDGHGTPQFIKDQAGNVVKSRLNEPLLQEIATKANGFYLPLRGAKTIETLYERGLAPLPKSDSNAMRVKRYHERYQWPLTLAVVLLIVECLLPARARKRVALSEAKPPALAATLALVLLASGLNCMASSSSAIRQYEAGRYDEALHEYRQLLTRKPDDARLNYNVGAAAYRNGQFDEATRQFSQATTAQDIRLQQQAYYNLGNSLFRLGEKLPAESPQNPPGQSTAAEPGNRIAAWERSLQNFESAMKLEPNDDDAKHNYEYVKRKLDELKKQQPQQQNNQDQSSKDQQQQQKQQQKDDKDQQSDQKRDDQKQQDSKQNQDQKDRDSSKDQNQQKDAKDQQQSQPQEQKPKSDEQKKQPQAGQTGKQDKPDQNAEAGEGETKPGQMTPQQARQLLDSQRGDEQLLKPVKPASDRPPAKDW